MFRLGKAGSMGPPLLPLKLYDVAILERLVPRLEEGPQKHGVDDANGRE